MAETLGINPSRVLQDHRGLTVSSPTRGRDRDLSDVLAALQTDIAIPGQPGEDTDPNAAALVQAAAAGDTTETRRLAAEVTDIDKPAPMPVPGMEALAGLGTTHTGAAPYVPMSPSLAAVTNRHTGTVAALLEVGADPNRFNDFYETPVFAACGVGDPDILRLLLDSGGDPNARNARGQTPLQSLERGRRSLEAVAQTFSGLESLGPAVPPELEQLTATAMPTEGWDACEAILRQYGGQA